MMVISDATYNWYTYQHTKQLKQAPRNGLSKLKV